MIILRGIRTSANSEINVKSKMNKIKLSFLEKEFITKDNGLIDLQSDESDIETIYTNKDIEESTIFNGNGKVDLTQLLKGDPHGEEWMLKFFDYYQYYGMKNPNALISFQLKPFFKNDSIKFSLVKRGTRGGKFLDYPYAFIRDCPRNAHFYKIELPQKGSISDIQCFIRTLYKKEEPYSLSNTLSRGKVDGVFLGELTDKDFGDFQAVSHSQPGFKEGLPFTFIAKIPFYVYADELDKINPLSIKIELRKN